jgi:gliding motility-associated-like protein
MKQIVFLLCLCLSLQVFSQEKWQHKINGFNTNYGVVLQKADSNGWMVASNTKSFSTAGNKNEIVIIRFNKCGNISWSYRYGSDTASITMTDMINDNGGNLVLTGSYSSPDDVTYNAKAFIMKLTPNGSVVWKKVFNLSGVAYIYSVGQTNDGGYFIFSNHDNNGGALPYNSISKISSTGNLVWYRHYDDNPIWGSAIKTTDGGILIRSGNLIYKLNASGSVLWSNTYNDIHYTTKPIEVNGQYIFASYPTTPSDSVSCLFSLSSAGNLNWISPGFNSVSVKSLKKLSNGNLLATGSIRTTASSTSKICITEFSSTGSIIQQQCINASPQQLPTSGNDFIELDNQAVICATIERNGTNDSLILLKSSTFSDFSCSQAINSAALPQPQISITPYSVSSTLILNQDFVPDIRKNTFTPAMTMNCFVPDTNAIHLGNDTTLCQNQHLILKTGLGANYQFIWSTGETTSSITIHQEGTYWVKAYNCDTISDTIVVNYVTPLTINYSISPLITNPYTLVRFENFTHPYAHISWQTGDGHTFTSDIFQHQYTNGGIYYPVLTITDLYGCQYTAQSKVIVDEVTFYIPNSFSPNADGSNDVFIPKCTGVEHYEIYIYSRWGEEIFSGVNIGWDGKLNGNIEATQGVYNYKIILKDIFGKESIRSGAITLFR